MRLSSHLAFAMFFRNLFSTAVLLAGLSAYARAHFVLEIPTSLGFDDEAETEAPCGGFNPRLRTNVTDWPIKGSAIGVLTTHDEATWEYKAALLSNLNHWVPLTRVLSQTGVGEFCEPIIPGKKSWVGQRAVLQVIQHGDDGDLYQVIKQQHIPFASPRGDSSLSIFFSTKGPQANRNWQCAAIKFVGGGPATAPAGCVNDTGIAAAWL